MRDTRLGACGVERKHGVVHSWALSAAATLPVISIMIILRIFVMIIPSH